MEEPQKIFIGGLSGLSFSAATTLVFVLMTEKGLSATQELACGFIAFLCTAIAGVGVHELIDDTYADGTEDPPDRYVPNEIIE